MDEHDTEGISDLIGEESKDKEQKEEEKKKEITSLDLRFLVKELRQNLIDGRIRKIYQYGRAKTKQLLFDIYVPGREGDLGVEEIGSQKSLWLYVDNNKIFITEYKKAVPQEPPSFCMFLRKHLMGKRIRNIRQHGFDRIIEIVTDDNILILELFSTGNVILCDSSYKIIMPLEIQRWKDRDVKPKIQYKYPPSVLNPFDMKFDVIMTLFKRSEKKIIAMLAKDLAFGSVYASEICLRSGIDEDKITNEITINEALRLHKIIEDIDSVKPNPCIYTDAVSPFPMSIYKTQAPEQAESFSDALDKFFSGQMIEIAKEEKKQIVEEKKEKIERIITQQEEAKEKWSEIKGESKEIADIIYSYYSTVEGVLEGIRKARDMNIPWSEIKDRIKNEQTPEAEAVKEIREGDGIVVLELGGKEVEIDIRLSVEENAAKYYEDAKWAKKKFAATETAMEEFSKKEEEIKSEEPESPETFVKKPEKKSWYEKFKWFFSSDGFLVIGGRSAEQNETILKKHTESRDMVFHADITGAAFVAIKSQGIEIPEETKKEAAEFAAANSKAWNKGLGTIDIFSVPRTQVSKTPPSGTHLPKGSFMITGERQWYRDMELKLSIGIKVNRENETARVLSGPVMAIRKNSDYFVTIKPGFKKSLDLARNIKNKILIKAKPEDKFLIEKVPFEDIQNVIPAGTGEIVEYVR